MTRSWLYIMLLPLLVTACDKEKDDLVMPMSADEFPQVIVLDDEGDGGLEDEDAFSFKLTLLDRTDATGKAPAGKITPLKEAVTINFKVTSFKGFNKLSDYIREAKAFYEIDDCTTSEDAGIKIPLQFDVNTGLGSVQFPAGVEELEVEFEVDDAFFDDDVFNTKKRALTIQLTGTAGNNMAVQANKTAAFTYDVQDDEAIYGEWELDPKDATAFARFKTLFGLVNEDIKGLTAAEVKKITFEVEYGEIKVVVKLKATEIVNECGIAETKNKEIEIETEIEELADDELEGDIEFGEVLELGKGKFAEFACSGSFKITGNQLTLDLKGELDDEETEDIALTLKK